MTPRDRQGWVYRIVDSVVTWWINLTVGGASDRTRAKCKHRVDILRLASVRDVSCAPQIYSSVGVDANLHAVGVEVPALDNQPIR